MIQRDLAVPPRAGAHLHTTKMAAELQRRGHDIQYFCFELDQKGPLPFKVKQVTPAAADEAEAWLKESWLMRKLLHYWATPPGHLLGLHRALQEARCDIVITSGLHGLLYLRPGKPELRFWYAADELFLATLSQVRSSNSFGKNWRLLAEAARLLLIQRWRRAVPDETWVVAQRDQRSMRRLLGKPVIWVPNGVDLEFFTPVDAELRPRSAVFWGRLDFGPNEQGLEFFLSKVWPMVRAQQRDSRLVVMGYSPSEKVKRLTEGAPGVELRADVPDIRPVVCSAPVAIFPFVSGTGVKNKLLEGAAMARALLASPMAVDGLRASEPPVWRICVEPQAWCDALLDLWSRPEAAAAEGRKAREWVEHNHSWESAGELAEESFRRAKARRAGLLQ